MQDLRRAQLRGSGHRSRRKCRTNHINGRSLWSKTPWNSADKLMHLHREAVPSHGQLPWGIRRKQLPSRTTQLPLIGELSRNQWHTRAPNHSVSNPRSSNSRWNLLHCAVAAVVTIHLPLPLHLFVLFLWSASIPPSLAGQPRRGIL